MLHLKNKEEAIQKYQELGTNICEFSLKGKEFFARVADIYDGDTLTLIIPVENSFFRYSVRMIGIDTCEIKSKHLENKKLAIRARNTLLKWVMKSRHINTDEPYTRKQIQDMLSSDVCLVWVKCDDFEKFGRILCNVYSDPSDIESFSERLIAEKLAYPYMGDTKLAEDEIFRLLCN